MFPAPLSLVRPPSPGTADALLKLIDFGFSKHLQKEEDRVVGAHGSTMYMAPEMFNQPDYDEQCDMWSLGVISYMLLTGKPPFLVLGDGGIDFNKTVQLIRKAEFKRPEEEKPGLSPNAVAFLMEMLVLDPKKRLTAAEAQGHKFFEGLDEVLPLSPDTIDSLKRSTSQSRLQNTFFQVRGSRLCAALRMYARTRFIPTLTPSTSRPA